jgi:glutamyl-tRNA synthetase
VTATPRLRFAPSPTGHLHIGGARTALFNWAYARRTGGKFLLRIEDTDRERSLPEYERSILEGLRWMGLDWDEGPDVGGEHGPYRQSERMGRYRAAADELLARGTAYRCFCTAERLDALREERTRAGQNPAYDGRCRTLDPSESARRHAAGEPAVVRFRVPEGRTHLTDLIRGEVVFDNRDVEDWVMVRTSGDPIYNFVVVVDDVDMAITHVLRGEEEARRAAFPGVFEEVEEGQRERSRRWEFSRRRPTMGSRRSGGIFAPMSDGWVLALQRRGRRWALRCSRIA